LSPSALAPSRSAPHSFLGLREGRGQSPWDRGVAIGPRSPGQGAMRTQPERARETESGRHARFRRSPWLPKTVRRPAGAPQVVRPFGRPHQPIEVPPSGRRRRGGRHGLCASLSSPLTAAAWPRPRGIVMRRMRIWRRQRSAAGGAVLYGARALRARRGRREENHVVMKPLFPNESSFLLDTRHRTTLVHVPPACTRSAGSRRKRHA
jgi:hypothetical protein